MKILITLAVLLLFISEGFGQITSCCYPDNEKKEIIDGDIKINLKVRPPAWSWLWLGLVYQPTRATVNVYKKKNSKWKKGKKVNTICVTLAGYGADDNTIDLIGSDKCENCSKVDTYLHEFSFPAPWAGSVFKKVGGCAIVNYNNKTYYLSNWWKD